MQASFAEAAGAKTWYQWLGPVSQPPQLVLADKIKATRLGGAAQVSKPVSKLMLAEEIDSLASVLRRGLPNSESDNVLNLTQRALCGGASLNDLELRRQGPACVNLLGSQRVPGPTAAGDVLRRFQRSQPGMLRAATDVARVQVWEEAPEFHHEAGTEG